MNEQGWQDIASAPEGEWVVGLRPPGDGYSPYFVGIRDRFREGALLNGWTGRSAICTHWMKPLPSPPEPGK